jgi:hypothetical protein
VTTQDDELREYLESATEIVESYVGPIVTRTHTARVCGYRRDISLPHTQVTAITAVTLVSDGSSPITLSDLTVDTAAGIISYKSGLTSFPYGDMDVTYTVGRTSVKANWTLAAKIIVKTGLGDPTREPAQHPRRFTGLRGDRLRDIGCRYEAIALLEPDDVPAGFA